MEAENLLAKAKVLPLCVDYFTIIMMFLYNIALLLYSIALRVAAIFVPKAKLWCDGRKGIFEAMATAITHDRPIAWVHIASLGEFEQGRPVIEKIRREYPDYQILITFFSPSGYEIRKNYSEADYVFYLPLDTPGNVNRFLDIVKPQVAIFVKYEFWLNYLAALKSRGVKTYIISAIFRRNSIFFKMWGGAWREALESFEILFVQDENSQKLLAELDIDNVVVAGDTRFDRVWDIAQASRELPEVERFVGEHKVMVAGSTWVPDEDILLPLIEKNPDVKFIIAPHEIDNDRVEGLISRLGERGVRYSTWQGESCQVLVLDTMGMLSSVYKYAHWGYIGGGFGVGIHNTLEAATFGLPIAFGWNYTKFKEACDLLSLGVARSVKSAEELDAWFSQLKGDEALREATKFKCLGFMSRQRGATHIIVDSIFRE